MKALLFTEDEQETPVHDDDMDDKILVSRDEFTRLKLTNECYSRKLTININRYRAEKNLKQENLKLKSPKRLVEPKENRKNIVTIKQSLSEEQKEFVERYNGT